MRVFFLSILVLVLLAGMPAYNGDPLPNAAGQTGPPPNADKSAKKQWLKKLENDLRSSDPEKKKAAHQQVNELITAARQLTSKMPWDNTLLKESRQQVGQLFSGIRSLIPDLPRLLEFPDEEMRYAAVEMIARLGPLAVAEHEHRMPLASQVTPAVPALAKVVKADKSLKVRAGAAYALGQIGPKAAPAVPALVQALLDKEKLVRRCAACALGRIGPDAAPAVPALIQALDDPDREDKTPPVMNEPLWFGPGQLSVPQWAAFSLGEIGPQAKAALPVLLKLHQDKNRDLPQRTYALWSLAKIGKADDPQGLPVLIAILQDPNQSEWHAAAAKGVWYLGAEAKAAILALVGLMDKNKAGWYQDADSAFGWFGLALRSMGPEAKAAVPHLIKLVQDPQISQRLRQEAIQTLGTIGPDAKEALPALMELFLALPNPNPYRPFLHQAFLDIGPAAVPHLLRAFESPNEAIRGEAIIILSDIGSTDQKVLDVLEALSISDPNSAVRREATIAFEYLSKKKQMGD